MNIVKYLHLHVIVASIVLLSVHVMLQVLEAGQIVNFVALFVISGLIWGLSIYSGVVFGLAVSLGYLTLKGRVRSPDRFILAFKRMIYRLRMRIRRSRW